MGLTKSNYTLSDYGITLPTAYAYCDEIRTRFDNTMRASFGVYKDREDALSRCIHPLETHIIEFKADKNALLWMQAYNVSKSEGHVFYGWDDDIVEE